MVTKRQGVSVDADPRRQRLNDEGCVCHSCGIAHRGVFDLAYAKPDAWGGSEEYCDNAAALTSTHFLSEDFCVLESKHFFVRCVLELPILGSAGARFGFGVWSTLSRSNFALYIEKFDSGDMAGLGPWFGWLRTGRQATRKPNLKCQVRLLSGRKRPLIELEPIDHPLVRDDRHGITIDRLFEIYAEHGHRFLMR